ncbi:MAG TPA: FAD:protein FMN transferase, partial [Paracoccaceae bacterium]
DGQRIRRRADVALDLNAIAKGHAADLAAQRLRAAGQRHFLIEVAGDIVAAGLRPDGLPWTVALELPVPDRIIPARLIPLPGGAIATSGGYRRARGGASHLIAPKTGTPLPADGASVAVLAPTALQADGWATVMAVLGPEAGLALAEARGLAVAFIQPDPPAGFVERGSSAMAALLDGRAA